MRREQNEQPEMDPERREGRDGITKRLSVEEGFRQRGGHGGPQLGIGFGKELQGNIHLKCMEYVQGHRTGCRTLNGGKVSNS